MEVPEEETDEETEDVEEPEENEAADEEETDENDSGQDAEEESEDGQDAQQTGSGADQQSDAVLTDEDAVISSNRKTIEGLFSALRSDGWHIASNSFGLVSYASQYEIMKEDAAKWQELVAHLVGGTDILLLPEKADIAGWSGYTEDNQRYQLLKELGFRQYCMEDEGTFTWAQIRPDYVRQGLHTIENYGDYTALMAAE